MNKRFALIIESGNVAGEKDLPGARADARNWHSFLMSDLGGAWREDEIEEMHKPSSACVRAKLQAHSNGYVFLVFSGHGSMEVVMSTGQWKSCICLNDVERNVRVDTVVPQSNATAIFDCCRGKPEVGAVAKCGHVLNEAFSMDSLANESIATKTIGVGLRACCRMGFDNGLESMSTRYPVTMFACAQGQGAAEDGSAGGFYTSRLIANAHAWKNEGLNHGLIVPPGVRILSTLDAHEMAREDVEQKTKGKQTPRYSPQSQKYPFAVRVER